MEFKVDDISQYPENGYVEFGQILDGSKCLHLREWINERRPISQDIFYKTKEEFDKKGRWTNYAPGRESHNLLLDSSLDLSFIEKNNKNVYNFGTFYQLMIGKLKNIEDFSSLSESTNVKTGEKNTKENMQ